MPATRTTLNYDSTRGNFRVSKETRGHRDLESRNVSFAVIDGIGDMDISNLARVAMHCPGRDFVLGMRVSA